MLNLGVLNKHTFLPKLIVSPSFFGTQKRTQKRKYALMGFEPGLTGREASKLPQDQENLISQIDDNNLFKLHLFFVWSSLCQQQMAMFFRFFEFKFFAEFLGFETNVISTHHGVTFHALVVSS